MLTYPRQEDFAGGIFRGVARHLVPENGCYDLINLLLDDDGSVYKRGGTAYQSNATFGSALTWVWDGYVAAGQRTVFANASDFGVLAADDATPVNLGGAGLTGPVKATELGGMLFIDGGAIYAGSRKAAGYSAGTIEVTEGSATITGTGTAWLANVDAGMLLRIGGAGRYYVVSQVGSDTSITLAEPMQAATASGLAYALTRLGTAGAPYTLADIYATAGTRLIACVGNKAFISAGTSLTGLFQPHVFDATEYHELPGASRILGAATVRDTLILFATSGVWSISNLSLDLTDDAGNGQHTVSQISADFILWGKAGLATWRNSIIAPTTNGIYLLDGISGPTLLSASIQGLLAEYVRAGYRPGGGAVFNSYYFLPILDGAGAPVDHLVCRLDRQVNTRLGNVWPWTRLADHAGAVVATTARRSLTGAPGLLGASTDAKVVRLTDIFSPTAGNDVDADDSEFRYRIDTRDAATGTGNRNLVRRLKMRYELVGDGEVRAYYSVGTEQPNVTKWDEFNWDEANWASADESEYVQLAGAATEDLGRSPYPWFFGADDQDARTAYIRARIESVQPADRFVLRSLEWAIRPSGREE